jgi:hypothetical protein
LYPKSTWNAIAKKNLKESLSQFKPDQDQSDFEKTNSFLHQSQMFTDQKG